MRRNFEVLVPYCPKCGYNLTGLREHRCPECGTEFDPIALLRGQLHQLNAPFGLSRKPPGKIMDRIALLGWSLAIVIGVICFVIWWWFKDVPLRLPGL